MAQPPPQKFSRQLQAADLPDPLSDSQDVPMASAEDLLSEIVGGEVERLMSGEYDPVVTTTGRGAVEQLQHQLGHFLDELRQRERPAARPAPSPPPARAVAEPHRLRAEEEDVAPPLDDLVDPTAEELVGLHSGEYEPAAARGPAESRALLAPIGSESEGDSLYLKPLDWISAPVAALSARGRLAVSFLAVISFVGSCAALGYVLMLREGIV